jgi:hypothetical protein
MATSRQSTRANFVPESSLLVWWKYPFDLGVYVGFFGKWRCHFVSEMTLGKACFVTLTKGAGNLIFIERRGVGGN